jgi:hypothetical protein
MAVAVYWLGFVPSSLLEVVVVWLRQWTTKMMMKLARSAAVVAVVAVAAVAADIRNATEDLLMSTIISVRMMGKLRVIVRMLLWVVTMSEVKNVTRL